MGHDGTVLVSGLVGGALAAGFGSVPNADAIVAKPLPSGTLIFDRSGPVLLADLHPPGHQHRSEVLALPLVSLELGDGAVAAHQDGDRYPQGNGRGSRQGPCTTPPLVVGMTMAPAPHHRQRPVR